MFWLARMFQKPQERGHTVIVLKFGEGTGKNIIIDILVRAFGDHASLAVKSDDLVGKFNDHLATSVLVFANEAVWGGSKDQEGVLKSLITDEDLPVERKYVPKYRVRNCVHLIMASNNDWVAPVGLDDRRFLILDVSEHRKGDTAYFKRLAEHIDNGGQEAFIDHLLKLDIGDFNPRTLPDMGLDQRTKRDAKVRGFDSLTQWWLHCLQTGEILLAGVSPAVDGT
ncbi:MAG: primase-helicase family protein [Thiocapsa sp. C3-sup]|uniref:primase-helicase family protein n=1 Tax=unclassified Thiocapsa TaxID=2641286 RepID=UPI0035B0C7FA